MLAGSLPIRFWRTGGIGFDARNWGSGRLALPSCRRCCVRRRLRHVAHELHSPAGLGGKATTVEAHYEGRIRKRRRRGAVGRVAGLVRPSLRLGDHYPSHIYIWAVIGAPRSLLALT